MKFYEEDNAALNYAKENGTIGEDYDAIYDAFKAGVEWMKQQTDKSSTLSAN